jgi:hypothetical protein
MAIIADDLSINRIVLLLDMALIVLLVWSTAREGDLLARAVSDEQMIDELPTVIRIEAAHGHRKQRADSGNRRADRLLTAILERDAFRPLGGDVGEHECVQILAAGALPAMPDEVDFEETGPVVLPVGEGANRGCPWAV